MVVNRRHFVRLLTSLPFGFFLTKVAAASSVADEPIVLVNGWILRVSDLTTQLSDDNRR